MGEDEKNLKMIKENSDGEVASVNPLINI